MGACLQGRADPFQPRPRIVAPLPREPRRRAGAVPGVRDAAARHQSLLHPFSQGRRLARPTLHPGARDCAATRLRSGLSARRLGVKGGERGDEPRSRQDPGRGRETGSEGRPPAGIYRKWRTINRYSPPKTTRVCAKRIHPDGWPAAIYLFLLSLCVLCAALCAVCAVCSVSFGLAPCAPRPRSTSVACLT